MQCLDQATDLKVHNSMNELQQERVQATLPKNWRPSGNDVSSFCADNEFPQPKFR